MRGEMGRTQSEKYRKQPRMDTDGHGYRRQQFVAFQRAAVFGKSVFIRVHPWFIFMGWSYGAGKNPNFTNTARASGPAR
jgi:hypothetical protein